MSVLHGEFNQTSEVTDTKDDYYVEDELDDNPCYYIIKKGGVEDENVVLKKPYAEMKMHLNPLFKWARIEGKDIYKVLFNGSVAINLMLRLLQKKIGKV